MTNPVLLNNIDHKDLRVITTHGAEYGDALHFATTFPSEFRDLQAHYPIVFRKSADGVGFEAVALLGFEEGENLFLGSNSGSNCGSNPGSNPGSKPGPNGWDASRAIYVPLMVERQPFLIGTDGGEMMVHVDMDNPRVNKVVGEAVFLPHGGSTEYLERVNSMLLAIHQGLQSMSAFTAALLEHGLLESFVFDIELDSGAQHRLMGYYTINEEKLAALDGKALASLHQSGHLQAVYMAIASLSNFRALIDRKNRSHAAGR